MASPSYQAVRALVVYMVCFAGGVIGPYLTGLIRDATGSFAAGLYAAAVGCLLSAALAMVVCPAWRLAPVPPLPAVRV